MPDKALYETVIGLEVHAQLLTRTKMFCSDSTAYGSAPNTQVSTVSLGHPGTLPVMNREVIGLAIRLGLACHCHITPENYFARKNYFYPDLPKGYQITQHTTPICTNGFLEVHTSAGSKKIRINRIHMEEDAGKSLHGKDGLTRIDYNRAGMPLLEIVTEPDIRSAEEAAALVTLLRQLVRHLGVCDGNMERGSLRCDVNISVRPTGAGSLGTKVEIKNLNSIRFIKKAVAYEEERLVTLVQGGGKVEQQTRGFDEESFTTYAIRTKEDEDDYRYFPEPDLPPFHITKEMIDQVRNSMPALPEEVHARLVREFGLTEYDASQISGDLALSALFFDTASLSHLNKATANWIIGPVRRFLQSQETEEEPGIIAPAALSDLIVSIEQGLLSYGTALNEVFPVICNDPQTDVKSYIIEKGLSAGQPEQEMDAMIDEALKRHAQKIPEYKKGKKGLIQVFVGEVMRASRGRADAVLITKKIIEKLNANS